MTTRQVLGRRDISAGWEACHAAGRETCATTVMSKNLGRILSIRNRPALPERVPVIMALAHPWGVLWPTERMWQRQQPVTGRKYMSTALLSTHCYVCVVLDTTPEEDWIRRKAGNTIDFFVQVLGLSCHHAMREITAPSRARQSAPRSLGSSRCAQTPKVIPAPPERIPEAPVVIASLRW